MTTQPYQSKRKSQRARERARTALADAFAQIQGADTPEQRASAERRRERVALTLAAIDETLRSN